MEIYGVTLEFSMYDEDQAEKREAYLQELEKMKHLSENQPEGTEKEKNQYLCDAIKGMFDHIFGEGTGIRVCGSGNDRLRHLSAYAQLIEEQIRQNEQYAQVVERMKSLRRQA